MFHLCTKNQIINLLTTVSFLAVSGFVLANSKKDNQITEVLSNIPNNQTQNNSSNVNNSTPNSSVELDFSVATGESWDARDSSNNVVANCINGSVITGFEYTNVAIQTSGGSFFSEAVIYFSDSNRGGNGLRLSTGAGDETSGSKVFSSNGILDLTDNEVDDVFSLNDGVFITQLYEYIDDNSNSIDARYTGGTVTVWGIDLVAVDGCPYIQSVGDGISSELSVVYTVDQESDPELRDSIGFTLTINNSGDGDATNVLINHVLSHKLVLNQMSCNNGFNTADFEDTISINIQEIQSGDTLICNIDASVVDYGFIENSVSVIAVNDSNASNNSAVIMLRGASRVVPINNYFALFMLAFALIYFARKRIM